MIDKEKLKEAMGVVWKNHHLADGPEILVLLDTCQQVLIGTIYAGEEETNDQCRKAD